MVFDIDVSLTFFDTGCSSLFVFCFKATLVSGGFGFKANLSSGGLGFNATLASGDFANSFLLKIISLGQFLRAVLKSDDSSKI